MSYDPHPVPGRMAKQTTRLQSGAGRPPNESPRRIASSYNIRNDPVYDPVALSVPVNEEEDEAHELEDWIDPESDEAEKPEKGASFFGGRKLTFAPRYQDLRQASGLSTARNRRRSTSAPQKYSVRRRSTVTSVKPDDIVTWEGPNDPQNPKNWPRSRKWSATVIISLFTFMAPVASSMVAPSLLLMAKDLHVTDEFQINLMLSIFILAFAIGPLLFGPLSEIYGRIPVLQITNLFYLIFNLACGFAQTQHQMLAFRFLAGIGGSAPSAIGGGVLGDCWWPEERGRAIAAYSLAPLLGPAVGPIAGGFIAQNISWRWVFFISTIGDACIQLVGLFFLQETYPPEILHRKAKRLRKSTGNKLLRTEFETPGMTLFSRIGTAVLRPFRLMFTQPIVQAMSIYMAFIYGLTFLVYATFTQLWTRHYGESLGISGLHYLSLSIGFALGTQILAPLNDRIYSALKKRNNNVGKPEFRIPLMCAGTVFVVIGLFWYGWSAQAHLIWIMPDIGMVFFSVGCDICFQCMTSYTIDCYTRYAASALAAMIVLRSCAGFGFPLFAPSLFANLGYGWGCSLLAFLGVGLGVPAPFLLWRFGPVLRKRSTFAAGD